MKVAMNILFATSLMIASASFAEDAGAASKGKLVAFYPGSTDTYVGALIKALKPEAEASGYEIEIIENGYFNQQSQDQQVQQYLALGEQPAAFLWWPSESEGGIGSLRALYNTGVPVFLMETDPTESTTKYIVGQSGASYTSRAESAAKLLVEARQKLKDEGHELHSDGGNAVALSYPAEYPGGVVSMEAFKKGLEGTGINLIGTSYEGFGAANGYTGAQKLIAQYKAEGIDLVYAMDDQVLQGAVKAFIEAGYQFNKNIMIVGSSCHGDRRLLDEGTQYATTILSPLIDAQLQIKVVDEYLTTGKLQSFVNTFPAPMVRWNEWKNAKMTDYHGKEHAMDDLCPWK